MKICRLFHVVLLASSTLAYDYVVVGGGTAYVTPCYTNGSVIDEFVFLSRGLTIASRLTDDPNVTVAVIEAGPNAENLPEVNTISSNNIQSVLTLCIS